MAAIHFLKMSSRDSTYADTTIFSNKVTHFSEKILCNLNPALDKKIEMADVSVCFSSSQAINLVGKLG